jgi:hypothetical protein
MMMLARNKCATARPFDWFIRTPLARALVGWYRYHTAALPPASNLFSQRELRSAHW